MEPSLEVLKAELELIEPTAALYDTSTHLCDWLHTHLYTEIYSTSTLEYNPALSPSLFIYPSEIQSLINKVCS